MRHFNFGTISEAERRSLADQFRAAQPFPHIVLQTMVSAPPNEVIEAFPTESWDQWTFLGVEAWQRGKRASSGIEEMPMLLAEMLHELNGPFFLSLLEDLTGITKLIADPYLEGGGLHHMSPGGNLSVHTDFHWYKTLDLYRRINVLVFLNEEWTEGDGGELMLFKKGDYVDPVVSVAPRWGTCVIFQTDDRSPHGVFPLTEGRPPRRSLACYYYTSSEVGVFSGDSQTYWRGHEPAKSISARARLAAYKKSIMLSRGFSQLAYKLHSAEIIEDRGPR